MTKMTPEEYEAAYAKAMWDARVKQVGERWLKDKRAREEREYQHRQKSKIRGTMGGHAKHEKRKQRELKK